MKEERTKALQNLKTVRGQIDGIIKMIEEDRYCVDISNQIMAANAILKKANMHILSGHLHGCVNKAMDSPKQRDEKLSEIEDILMKILK
ncbi:MAG: metal-sensing transcriptional repressor [Erysipelotrichaceae bacterium]